MSVDLQGLGDNVVKMVGHISPRSSSISYASWRVGFKQPRDYARVRQVRNPHIVGVPRLAIL